jgi:hypothetical protein
MGQSRKKDKTKNTEGVQNYKRLIINEIVKRFIIKKRRNTEG